MRNACRLALAFCSLAFFSAGTDDSAATNRPLPVRCDPADNVRTVAANELCLVIRTFMPSGNISAPILRIYLHGDVSRGGPADYLYRHAEQTPPGIVSVAMLRPGYYDGKARRSTGSHHRRRDSYTVENVDAIAAAVRTLARHHRASRVVLVGHAGGAAIAAVIAGRHPGLADAALLVSCPCDLPAWRKRQGRSPWPNSLDPLAFVDGIPTSTEIIVISGERDDNTPPDLCRNYVDRLVERGVSAALKSVPGAGHGFRQLGASAVFRNALSALDSD